MAKNFGSMLGRGLMGGIPGMLMKDNFNPMLGVGGNLLMNLFKGEDKEGGSGPENPGQAMFGMNGPAEPKKPTFMGQFKNNLQEQLFQKAMQGFMGHMQ